MSLFNENDVFGPEMISFVNNEIALGNEVLGIVNESLGRASFTVKFKKEMRSGFEDVFPIFGISGASHISCKEFHIVDLMRNYTNAVSVSFPLSETDMAQQSIPLFSSLNSHIESAKKILWSSLIAHSLSNYTFLSLDDMYSDTSLGAIVKEALALGFTWESSNLLTCSKYNDVTVVIEFEGDAKFYYQKIMERKIKKVKPVKVHGKKHARA